MKRWIGFWLSCAWLLAAGGCGTIQQTYVPQSVGQIPGGIPDRGVRVSIEPAARSVPVGQDVVFTVTLTNLQVQPIRVPRRPHVVFHWTYSNGRRDNYVMDQPPPKFYQPSELTLLQPGDSHSFRYRVPTGYFPRTGITEFQAVASAPHNTNPSLEPVWSGEAHSNRYGILMRQQSAPPDRLAQSQPAVRPARPQPAQM